MSQPRLAAVLALPLSVLVLVGVLLRRIEIQSEAFLFYLYNPF